MDEFDRRAFFNGCVMTYGAATRLMAEVWQAEVGSPMGNLAGPPKVRFRQALGHFVDRIRAGDSPALDIKLREATQNDDILRSLITDSLAKPEEALAPDIDDVPPAVFKTAIWEEAVNRAGEETIDVDLAIFLRSVVKRVTGAMGWKGRLNVGANRHFPRMVQWLREVQDETTFDDGRGVRLMNRAGRGKVSAFPAGPHGLKVRLCASWL